MYCNTSYIVTFFGWVSAIKVLAVSFLLPHTSNSVPSPSEIDSTYKVVTRRHTLLAEHLSSWGIGSESPKCPS